MSTVIRRATEADKDFLITSIIEAEKSGSDVISYCAIFSITEPELRELLGNILDEDIEGQELCIPNFLIAEVNGEKAAAISGWVKQDMGMAGTMLKGNLYMYFLGQEKMISAAPSLTLMNEVNIDRENDTLQLECVYTNPAFRGRGLSRQLIDEHIRLQQAEGIPFSKVQIQLLKNNESAIKAYQKGGFSIVMEKKAADTAILKLLPCDTKILMEKHI